MPTSNSRNLRLKYSRIYLGVFLVFLLPIAPQAFAQTGSVTGLVTDLSGAVIPGAEVTIVANTTGLSRQVSTADSGTYSLLDLPPTVYTLTVQKGGFEKAVFSDVHVTVGEVVPLNVKLQVGTTTTEVSVNAST